MQSPKSMRYSLTASFKANEMRPEKDGIFKNIKFCYLPDNGVCETRKFRTKLAQSNNAIWVKGFSPEVTHMIVDDNKICTYEWIAKYLELSSRAESMIVVNERFQMECIQQKKIQDHRKTVSCSMWFISANM